MSQEPTTSEYIQQLADPGRPAPERLAALGALQVASMQGDLFDPHRTDYRAALRAASEAEDLDLRLRVLKILCTRKDRDTQRRLIEGLEDASKELAPPAKALQFLSYDIHAGVFPIARQFADNPPNDDAQHEALRLLGSDPGATDLFVKILADSSEDYQARSLAAGCLSSLAPDRYVRAGTRIVADPGENLDLRTEMLLGLVRKQTDPEDEELRLAAESVAQDDSSNESMRRSARTLLAQTPGPARADSENGTAQPSGTV